MLEKMNLLITKVKELQQKVNEQQQLIDELKTRSSMNEIEDESFNQLCQEIDFLNN